MGRALLDANSLGDRDLITLGGEGMSKTTALTGTSIHDALDMAIAGDGHLAFTFRSKQQRDARADEFSEKGLPVVTIRTVHEQYELACETLGEPATARDDFDEASWFEQVRERQPDVFAHMDRVRRELWVPHGFSSGALLFMTTAAARHWPVAHLTRAWNHPDFDPDAGADGIRELSEKFRLAVTVVDDPATTDFLTVLDEEKYEALGKLQAKSPRWKNIPRAEKLEWYRAARADGILKAWMMPFDALDELMRLDLESLIEVVADRSDSPLGHGGEGNIYRAGKLLRVKPVEWSRHTRIVLLTTERVVAEVARRELRERPRTITRQDGRRETKLDPVVLDLECRGVYPVDVDVHLDDRASRRKVTQLARELQTNDPRAIVVSNMVDDESLSYRPTEANDGPGGVITFQSVKGLNGLEHRDVHVIVTYPSPVEYEELLAVGRRAGIEDVVAAHLRDQVSQAVGRNTGFRAQGRRATLWASRRLWRDLGERLSTGRFRPTVTSGAAKTAAERMREMRERRRAQASRDT
jgi:hypothetical protein